MSNAPATNTPTRLGADFWRFWTGQTLSALGSSFTGFALPLLIFKLTGSALNLGLAMAAGMLPYLLFGLLIGAWVDRIDRKRLMISADFVRAAVIASIAVASMFDVLSVWWIYAVLFINSTVSIAFDAADFAAIPSLVGKNGDLVTANGRIQASYAATFVIGPVLAGALVSFMSIPMLVLIDAASYIISAFMLMLVRVSFNDVEGKQRSTSLRQDVVEGLRYVLGHPVLRMISLMMALVNFVSASVNAQLVLFASQRLGAKETQLGLLYSAGSVGVVVLSLLAGTLRKRLSFSKVALGALTLSGLMTIVFSQLTSFWVALPVWAMMSGLALLFNINTGSLRQAIVPSHLLGRVLTIAGVLAWSAIPLGALLGGYLIERTGNVALIYMGIGMLTTIIPIAFSFTPLGHAEDYLPKKDESQVGIDPAGAEAAAGAA